MYGISFVRVVTSTTRVNLNNATKKYALGIVKRSLTVNANDIGVNFGVSEEHLQLKALAQRFTLEEIIPKAAHYDRTGEYPWDVIKKAWKLGLLNKHASTKYGGAGLSLFDGCMLSEELGYGCTGIETAIEANSLGVL